MLGLTAEADLHSKAEHPSSDAEVGVVFAAEPGFWRRRCSKFPEASCSLLHPRLNSLGTTPASREKFYKEEGGEHVADATPLAKLQVKGDHKAVPIKEVAEPRALQKRRPPALKLHGYGCLKGSRPPDIMYAVRQRGYDLFEVLGSGSSATVHRAVRQSDGQTVALKAMRFGDEELACVARREFELLRKIPPHTGIVQAIDCHELGTQAVLVLEYVDGLSLEKAVQEKTQHRLPECTARMLASSLFQAVAHLHENEILHRDIKPQNVLVSRDMDNIKLIDFNVAWDLRHGDCLTPTGTDLYKAPEILKGDSPTASSDVWAAGLCLFFMLSGRLPQGREKLVDSKQKLIQAAAQPIVLGTPVWDKISEPCKEVLSGCLAINTSERMMSTELLEHEWVWSACPTIPSFTWVARAVCGLS